MKKKEKRKLKAFLLVLVAILIASDIGFVILYRQSLAKDDNFFGENNKSLNIIKEEERTLPKTYTVKLTVSGLEPSELEIRKGDTVVWINENINLYEILLPVRNKEFRSNRIFIGENYTHTFNNDGEFE